MNACGRVIITFSSTSSFADPAFTLSQDVGCEGRCIGPSIIIDLVNDLGTGRGRKLIECLPQRRGAGFDVDSGGRDIFVTEHTLNVGNGHAEADESRCYSVFQQRRVDPLGNTGIVGDGSHDLGNTLTRVDMRRVARSFSRLTNSGPRRRFPMCRASSRASSPRIGTSRRLSP